MAYDVQDLLYEQYKLAVNRVGILLNIKVLDGFYWFRSCWS